MTADPTVRAHDEIGPKRKRGPLTAIELKHLPPGEYRDAPSTSEANDGVAGLIFRVRADGSKSWSLRYSAKRRRERARFSLGPYPRVTLAEARDLARARLRGIHAGAADPAIERSRIAASDSFEALANKFLAENPRLSPNTRTGYRANLGKHAFPTIGATPAVLISADDVKRAMQSAEKAGSLVMADRVRAAIGSVYRWGLREKLLPQMPNPAHGVSSVADAEPRVRPWTDAEIVATWRALDVIRTPKTSRKLSPATADAIRLCLLTGSRRTEVAQARKSEFQGLDGDTPVWHVPGDVVRKGKRIRGRTKNHVAKLVPLSPQAAAIVRAAIARNPECPHLFAGKTAETPIDPHTLTTAMKRVHRHLGVEDANLHDLRTNCRTWLKANGYSRDVRDAVLGHKGSSVGERVYEAADPIFVERYVRPALVAWADHVARLVGAEARPDNVVPLKARAG